jgi:Domain of unknown function (DUF1937)
MNKQTLGYLATPYTKFPNGIEQAFIAAAKLTARLLRMGLQVYSPIAHTHPVGIYGGIDPLDLSIWLPFDEAMLRACDVLIVAHMESWETSKGIAHEIDFFTRAGKPIFDLDPLSLAMMKRMAQPIGKYERLGTMQPTLEPGEISSFLARNGDR